MSVSSRSERLVKLIDADIYGELLLWCCWYSGYYIDLWPITRIIWNEGRLFRWDNCFPSFSMLTVRLLPWLGEMLWSGRLFRLVYVCVEFCWEMKRNLGIFQFQHNNMKHIICIPFQKLFIFKWSTNYDIYVRRIISSTRPPLPFLQSSTFLLEC